MNFPSVELSSGYKMPVLGLGTFLCPPQDSYTVTKEAIKIGYRHIDTAEHYYNENGIGKAISECIQEGIVKREELFVTTKMFLDFPVNEVEKVIKTSMKNLQLDYIDLVLIHNPFSWELDKVMMEKKSEEERFNVGALADVPFKPTGYDPKRVADTWAVFEKLVEEGYIRSIGISNFTAKKTEELLKTAKILPVTNQIEFNPPMQQPTVVKYCLSKGISITAYTQFGRASDEDPERIPLKNSTIAAIGKKYNKSNAQVIIRWLIQRHIYAIPKTVHPDRMRENLNVFDFELSEEDMETMNNLNMNDRTYDGRFFAQCGLTTKEVWDYEDCERL